MAVSEADCDDVASHVGVGSGAIGLAERDASGATQGEAHVAVFNLTGSIATVARARVSVVALLCSGDDSVAHKEAGRRPQLISGRGGERGDVGVRERVGRIRGLIGCTADQQSHSAEHKGSRKQAAIVSRFMEKSGCSLV